MLSRPAAWPPPVQPTPEVVARAVEHFYRLVLADGLLRHWFRDTDMAALRAHQTEFLLSALAGARDQSFLRQRLHHRLELAHHGLAVDDESFDRVLVHLEAALRGIGMAGCQLEESLALVAGLRPHVVDPPYPLR